MEDLEAEDWMEITDDGYYAMVKEESDRMKMEQKEQEERFMKSLTEEDKAFIDRWAAEGADKRVLMWIIRSMRQIE